MEKIRRKLLDTLGENFVERGVVVTMICVHFGLGAAILIGGIERFQIPTYQPLIDMTNGRIWIWGIVIVASGALIIQRSRWANIIGLWIGMAWMIMWSALFVVSMLSYEKSAATPSVVYAGLAAINGTLLTRRFIGPRKE